MDPNRGELLSSKPTKDLLWKEVVPATAHEWLNIGVYLGMDVAILKDCKATESIDLKLCCLEMYEHWLQESKGTGEKPRTWSTVLSAVKASVGHNAAESIEMGLKERNQK